MMNQLRSFTESHNAISQVTKDSVIGRITGLCCTLGILEKDAYKEAMPEEVGGLVKSREELRKQGKFADADRIRADLKERYGLGINDTEYGPVVYKD
jgi:cysteinyl-tRNA synthetase